MKYRNDSLTLEPTIIDDLVKLGLTRYEALSFAGLVLLKVATPSELADFVNIPKPKIYDTLRSLERKGFVMMMPGRPLKYKAFPPQEAILRRIEELKNSAEEVISRLKKLQVEEAEKVEEILWILKGSDNVSQALSSIINRAKRSLKIFAAPDDPALGIYKDNLESAVRRGVVVKLLIPVTAENLKTLKALPSELVVRHVPWTPMSFYLVDHVEALIRYSSNVGGSVLGVHVTSEAFTKMFDTLFENTWNSSISLEEQSLRIEKGGYLSFKEELALKGIIDLLRSHREEGEIRLSELRVTLVPSALFGTMQRIFEKMTGAEIARQLLYIAGKEVARLYVEAMRKVESFSNLEDCLFLFQELESLSGWGDIEVMEFDPENLNFRFAVKNSYAKEAFRKGETGQPVCSLMAGLLAGTIEALINKPIDLVEVKCWAKGDDNCEFIVER